MNRGYAANNNAGVRCTRGEVLAKFTITALMLVSLIERQMRLELQERHIERLPLRPAGMQTQKPTIENLQPMTGLLSVPWR